MKQNFALFAQSVFIVWHPFSALEDPLPAWDTRLPFPDVNKIIKVARFPPPSSLSLCLASFQV